MVKQLYDILLHKLTRHTNMHIPYCRFISGDVFPRQNPELLNMEVTLKYRNHYIVDNSWDPPSGRPEDDFPFLPKEQGPEEDGDQHDVYTEDFIVVRADFDEPYRLIAISKDYTKILVNSSRRDEEGNYAFQHLISEYAVQDNKFFALDLVDQYAGEVNELQAVSVRCDSSEPCYSIMLEFLGSTNMIRFVLGDEVMSCLMDYYDHEGVYDYNNAGAAEEEYVVDVDGFRASHLGLHDVKNIDAGSASNMWRLLNDKRAGELQYFGPDQHYHELDPDAPPITDFDMETLDVTNPEMFSFKDEDTLEEGAEGDWNFGDIDPASGDTESIPDVREEVYMDWEQGGDFLIVEPEKEITIAERAEFLRTIMEGKVIYGTV